MLIQEQYSKLILREIQNVLQEQQCTLFLKKSKKL